MRTLAVLLLCALAANLAATERQSLPVRAQLTGGGEVSISRDGPQLLVTVTGPRAGLASLCVGDDSRVRILHASAAVGEAIYEREGERWLRRFEFEWKLRDSRKTPITEADRNRVFAELGWVANPDNAGVSPRVFAIQLSERTQYLGVTFFTTSDPMAVSYWPATMDDGCREVKVAQGYLPETAQFRPTAWHRMENGAARAN